MNDVGTLLLGCPDEKADVLGFSLHRKVSDDVGQCILNQSSEVLNTRPAARHSWKNNSFMASNLYEVYVLVVFSFVIQTSKVSAGNALPLTV